MRYEGPGPDSCHGNSTFETIMIWIAIILIATLFGGLFIQGTKDVLTKDVPGMVEGTTYYFVATAYDDAGNVSEYSNEVSITIPVPDTDWGSKGPGTKVNIHNTSDDLTLYNFVRFDHDVLWYNGPAIQSGGGVNPKNTNISKNRPPGIYGIRFSVTGKFEFRKVFSIMPGLKEVTIKLYPTQPNPIVFECDCEINKSKYVMGWAQDIHDIYRLTPK